MSAPCWPPEAEERTRDLDKAGKGQVGDLSFEQALAELEEIVGGLEKGTVALEQSIAMYERADALRKRCDALLRQAEARVEKIAGGNGEALATEPFDSDG
ncbi:MAG: exodeoxyribonuclease VII small subunit [Rhodobiaceae bacterium]|nr:exodeoxyribonuclease VII small subunit [Rhodobiaceae bacterium]